MKSILIIVPFACIYPPMNGGMQRCFNVINQLAKYFELTLICFEDKDEFLKAAKEYPAIANIKIYSTKEEPGVKDNFNLLPNKLQNALRYRWYKKEFRGPADGMFLQYYPVLIKLLERNKYEVIILENLATLNAISIVRKYDKQVQIIYDAHNVDSNLAETGVEKWGTDTKNQSFINKAESILYKNVNAILACSQNDLVDLRKMNGNKLEGIIIPNGVKVANSLFDEGVIREVPEYVLFCGSLGSIPNSEGLLWFYNTIWPLITKSFPYLKLLVVGSGKAPDTLQALINDTSIQFTGAVDDVKPWYNKAAIAIVPLLSGSGTRLKILEAMSLGLPVISTSKGAEGIDYTNGQNIIIADEENDFAEAVMRLLKNKEKRIALQKEARKLVEEKYDWNIIGNSLEAFIKEQKEPQKTIKLNFGFFWKEFDSNNNYFTNLLSKRYHVVLSDDPDFYIFTHPYYNGKKDYLNFKCHRIFFGFENVRADWNICDYVFDPDYYTNNPRHKRYPLWSGYEIKKLALPKDLNEFRNKKKFCCMLVSNPAAKERIEFFHKLSGYKKVDSAGQYLNNVGHPVDNKMEFIKDYKFVISFENSSYPGYTTEKLIEPMLVNSIPIYWGNPLVGEDFNTKSFVNVKDFPSYDEAIKHIVELDNNAEKYLELASQPWFNGNRIAEEFSEDSVLDFFDFIILDSKKRRPVAKSSKKKMQQQKYIIKAKFPFINRKLTSFKNLLK